MTATAPSASGSAPVRMPVLFVGHGSPMNAIEDNRWSRAFRELGQSLPTPRAVLAVSAHWYVPGTFVTNNARPETIHDFGGFPRQLHEMIYPAPGDPALAERVRQLLTSYTASARSDWGLDHGTWSVLCHVRPDADVPVLQLSIDARLPLARHVEIGRALAPLRDDGVLILGSGNIVHNLRDAFGNMRAGRTATPRWASDFDAAVARAIEQRDAAFLSTSLETDTGRQSHPTADHYLPLLYSFGASAEADAVSYPIQGFDAGSLSMRTVRFG
ncbi:MAG TPA: 4,5-DOPA dioxygenase extradiol [Polyangiaceae bacterium]|nr:4,5-DOPA dioxygenase extradiol [Polyangiaceae bacterium]